MWRENSHTSLFSEQTEAGQYSHFSENRNIAFQNVDGNLQHSNIQGVHFFQNGLQHLLVDNNAYYGQQTGQMPPMIASNVVNKSTGIHLQSIKRKCEDDYSPYHPTWKQHITDERMAAGMDNLYITNDHNYCSTSKFNPDEDLNMDFNDVPRSMERIGDNCDAEKNNKKTRSKRPVFQFCAPLEQLLKNKSEILPPNIIKEIYKPSLAVVPWTPPLNNEENFPKETKKERVKSSTEVEDEDDFSR